MRNLTRMILLRSFGRPKGVLGRLGGHIMAHMNAGFGAWIGDLLDVEPRDKVLEVGCGPGAVLRHLSGLAQHVSGVDVSTVMVEQARARNKAGIEDGRVAVLHGSVDDLPFDDESFDKALAVNSMQVWPDAFRGLEEMRRVIRPGGSVALGFTRHSGQSMGGVTEQLFAAGFARPHVITSEEGFCALAMRS